VAALFVALETYVTPRDDQRSRELWGSLQLARAAWFAGISLVFGGLVLGCNYAAYVWVLRLGDPKITEWFFPIDYKYLIDNMVDGFAVAAAFIALRLPLWNLAASAEDAREKRRDLGEWLIGRDVVKRERDDLTFNSDSYWQNEIKLQIQVHVDDYCRRNPICPNPAAHLARAPKTIPPPENPLESLKLDF
jgi:hypothetical protein